MKLEIVWDIVIQMRADKEDLARLRNDLSRFFENDDPITVNIHDFLKDLYVLLDKVM